MIFIKAILFFILLTNFRPSIQYNSQYNSRLSPSMNHAKFALCAGTDLFSCQYDKLKKNFDLMKQANCLNCDKYFHCQGNYDAVYKCSNGNKTKRESIAKKLSDCREKAQNSSTEDSKQDQIANSFGRSGANCATKYLCKAGCKFNPINKTCKKTNCP